jgi:DNA-binding NarL/FixJ family response regulator
VKGRVEWLLRQCRSISTVILTRKVAAGERFVSPRLAEATTFAGAAIKASPLMQMSARELEILRLLGRGDRVSEMATELGISYKTGREQHDVREIKSRWEL